MLINEFLPEFDVVERHQAIIRAPVARVYAALHSTDFGRPILVRTLLALRALPSLLPGRNKERTPHAERNRALTLGAFLGNGFILLSERKEKEIVLGLVGRFWTPTGCLEKTDAARFIQEKRPGLAKAAWNFALEPIDEGTRVITETRVKCMDRPSRIRFRVYWLFVRPFSGLLRRYMLRELRRASEGPSDA